MSEALWCMCRFWPRKHWARSLNVIFYYDKSLHSLIKTLLLIFWELNVCQLNPNMTIQPVLTGIAYNRILRIPTPPKPLKNRPLLHVLWPISWNLCPPKGRCFNHQYITHLSARNRAHTFSHTLIHTQTHTHFTNTQTVYTHTHTHMCPGWSVGTLSFFLGIQNFFAGLKTFHNSDSEYQMSYSNVFFAKVN